MSLYRGTYYYSSGCTGSARPGAAALMSWYLGAYGIWGAANLGIYVCKRLGSGYSIHAEGRACDLGTAPYNDPGGDWPDWGWALANALKDHSAELGIQLIIYRRRVWSCRYADKGWRTYSGSDPHDGHLHAELTPEAARALTVDKIESILGGTSSPGLEGGIMFVKYGDGEDNGMAEAVQYWQRLLEYVGIELPKYGPDGGYGDETKAAVARWYKRRTGKTYSGARITSWIAANLQKEYFDAGGATNEQIRAAVEAFFAANPPKDGKDGKTPTKIKLSLTGDVTGWE